MASDSSFNLSYAPVVFDHIRAIDRKYYSLIRDTLAKQLVHEPLEETRNRKPLERPIEFGATWEIRFGPRNRFRAFYDVDQARRTVFILAIGIKEGNRLIVGHEEIEL